MNLKTKKVLFWLITILISIQFLAAGLGKFVGAWTKMFENWGYPAYAVYLVGGVEVIAIIALYFPKHRKIAISILFLTMLGAIGTHLINEEYLRSIHNIVIMLVLVALYYLDKSIKHHIKV